MYILFWIYEVILRVWGWPQKVWFCQYFWQKNRSTVFFLQTTLVMHWGHHIATRGHTKCKLRHPVTLKRSRPKRCENSLAECHSNVSGQHCITLTRITLASNSRRVASWMAFFPSQLININVLIFLKSCLAHQSIVILRPIQIS